MASTCTLHAAYHSGVRPSLSFTLTVAPKVTSRLITTVLLIMAAQCNAVKPSWKKVDQNTQIVINYSIPCFSC